MTTIGCMGEKQDQKWKGRCLLFSAAFFFFKIKTIFKKKKDGLFFFSEIEAQEFLICS